jgi:hypothetical protein
VRSHAAVEGRRWAPKRRASERGRSGLSRLGLNALSLKAARLNSLGLGRFLSRRPRLGPWAVGIGGTGLLCLVVLLVIVGVHLARPGSPAGYAAKPTGGCAAQYVANPGAGGTFTAEVAITNTGGSRLVNWSLEFALPAGQRITDAHGLRWDQRGDAVTLHGPAPLETGHTQRLSLTGTSASAPVAPSRFNLDGASCTPAIGAAVPPASATPSRRR